MADEETRSENLVVLQSMIDISAYRLEGMRTQCATSEELTQQEIRTLEVSISAFYWVMVDDLCLLYVMKHFSNICMNQ
jgi:hypothetical protein